MHATPSQALPLQSAAAASAAATAGAAASSARRPPGPHGHPLPTPCRPQHPWPQPQQPQGQPHPRPQRPQLPQPREQLPPRPHNLSFHVLRGCGDGRAAAVSGDCAIAHQGVHVLGRRGEGECLGVEWVCLAPGRGSKRTLRSHNRTHLLLTPTPCLWPALNITYSCSLPPPAHGLCSPRPSLPLSAPSCPGSTWRCCSRLSRSRWWCVGRGVL